MFLIWTAACGMGAEEGVARGEVAVPLLEGTPFAAGVVDDPWMKKGVLLDHFSVVEHPPRPAAKPTRVRLGYTREALYLFVECDDAEIARTPSAREDGSAVFGGDTLELFLQAPNADYYHHLAISPDGARFHSHGPKEPPVELKEWKVTARKHAGGWQAQLKIPFAVFGLKEAVEGPWRLNVARCTRLPVQENTLWNYVPENDPEQLRFHQSRNFVPMKLAGAPAYKASESMELVNDGFDSYGKLEDRPPTWQISTYGDGEIQLEKEQFHRAEHPDAPNGGSIRFLRSDKRSGASFYGRFASIPTADVEKVVIQCAAMTTVENSIFYPIVVEEWAARVGFGRDGRIFHSQATGEGEEELVPVETYRPMQWYRFRVEIDPEKQRYDFYLDDRLLAEKIPLTREVATWGFYRASTGGSDGGDPEQIHYLDDVNLRVETKGSGRPAPPPVAVQQPPTPRRVSGEVSGFGRAIRHGEWPSVVKDEFPLGMTVVVGADTVHKKWRWLGNREQGRLDALAAWGDYRELALVFPERGEYEVEWLFVNAKVHGGALPLPGAEARAPGDAAPDRLSPRFQGDDQAWVPWKRVTLDGSPVTLAHVKGRSTAIRGVRLIPKEGAKVSYLGEKFVELVRATNAIYEEQNPDDIEAALKELLPQLKALHVETLDVNGPTSAEGLRKVLDELSRNGMKAIVSIRWMPGLLPSGWRERAEKDPVEAKALLKQAWAPTVEEIKDHPALLAYRLLDEPFVEEIPVYSVVFQAMRELDPAHPVVSYLCRASWNSDETSRRGVDNMKKWVEGVREEVLFNDLYPIRYPESVARSFLRHYMACLEDNQRQAGGRPLWILAQAIDFANTLRAPTPAEIRAQAYLSLAYGARGLIFYNFNGSDNTVFGPDGSLNASGREIGRVLGELKPLAPRFLGLERVELKATVPEDFAIQGFTGKEGERYLVVVNADVTAEREMELALASDLVESVTDLRSGQKLPRHFEGGKLLLNLKLAPGDGRVLELNRK
ncbi:MAG TPA: hypothetical protein VNQ90_08745 [Chthoniobacteraceae bacterium]|nr:hypothetical protein [Chthoniobacteraceae bacterium]